MKATHLILHGSYGTPRENWFPWLKAKLEDQGHATLAPQFPIDVWPEASANGDINFVPQHQSLDKWLETFSAISDQLEFENLTVIAHSSAPLFMLHVLNQHPELRLRQALFVAPFLGKIGEVWQIETVNRSFYTPANFDFPTVRQQIENSTIFYSDNDPYVPIHESKLFAKKIGADTIRVADAGHFNAEAGYTEFPLLLNHLLA